MIGRTNKHKSGVMPLLSETAIDLVILDVVMPEVSGIELLKQLKRDAHTAALPVIVSSGYVFNESVVRSLGAAWIAKPWTAGDLLKGIARLLATEESWDEQPWR